MAEATTKLPIKNEKTSAPRTAGEWMPFESLHREIDRLFEDFHPLWRPAWRSIFAPETRRMRAAEWQVLPAMDVVEKEDEYEITAELPGLDEKNIEVKLANDTLTIKGEKKEEKEEKAKDFHMSERRFGYFQRSFQIPEGVDTDKIDASFTKGVLTVKLPKTMEAKKAEKKITVKGS